VIEQFTDSLQMEPAKFDPPSKSTCTTCTYSEDFSNYWTASLYFKSPDNGTFQRVPQFANVGLQQDGSAFVSAQFVHALLTIASEV
jgi:hypothetical protein